MHGGWKSATVEQDIARITKEIDQRGYGAIENYLSDEELASLRAFAEFRVRAAGGEYVGLAGADAVRGTVLSELPRSAEFRSLCRRIYELGTGRRAPQPDFYQVLRCLHGLSGQRHSNRFHYDSYILTALIPIAIPETGMSGDLVLLPNARAIRSSYLGNMLDKIAIDNPFSQAFLRAAARRNRFGMVRIRLRPGSIYFFWGYRSIHANEACDRDRLRATALFHYVDPHQQSWARGVIRAAKARMGRGPLETTKGQAAQNL
ncbi:MAG TPA: hypothetical protein VMA37_15320 [Acetobacteraceae bacterium]|nr:hypothetical protein [Acetobacteraceae bacterium]